MTSAGQFAVSTDLSRRGNLVGIATTAAGNAVLVVNDTLVKLASAELPMSEVICLRALAAIAFLFVGSLLLPSAGVRGSRWRRPLLMRSGLEIGTSFTYLYALAMMPIADLAGIVQIVPLAILAGGALVFGERIGWRGWTTTSVGLIGALMIVRPGMGAAESGVGGIAAALAALAVIFQVVRDLVTRAMPIGVSAPLVAGTSQAAMLAGAMCLAPFDHWVMPDPWVTTRVVAAAALLAIANYWLVIAMRTGRLAVVGPFRYAGLIAALVSGLVVWGEFPDTWALIGTSIITASGLLNLMMDRSRSNTGGVQESRP